MSDVEENITQIVAEIDNAQDLRAVRVIIEKLSDFYQERILGCLGAVLIAMSEGLEDKNYAETLVQNPDNFSSMHDKYIKYKEAIVIILPDAFTSEESPLSSVAEKLDGFFARNMPMEPSSLHL
jgi:hypothetical protein